MPPISKEKLKKIKEQVVYYLYSYFPKSLFTSEIAKELARDEEFMKTLLLVLNKEGLIIKIDKNPDGIRYERRLRWRLSNKTHETYKQMQ